MIELLFWFLVALILYVYFGYPLLLLIVSNLRPAPPVQKADITPTVSLIVAAYNEEQVIAQKIENSLSLHYPKDKLEVIVASDGSTDRTNEIVSAYAGQGVRLVALNANRGKSSAQNAAVDVARGEILLFSDATGMYEGNLLAALVPYLADHTVGCVAGRPCYRNVDLTATSRGEGAYLRYELLIRSLESRFGNLVSTSGTVLAVRACVFEPLDEAVGEDLVLPMKAAIRGFRTIHAPEVVSSETVTTSSDGMLRTRIRVTAKDLRGVLLNRSILNPLRHPGYAWGLVSHKLLRWFVPVLAIAALMTNLALLGIAFYRLVLLMQAGLYLVAFCGHLWQKRGNPPQLLNFAYIFCLYNLAALLALGRVAGGKVSGRWQPIR